jgi:hypothetical protein
VPASDRLEGWKQTPCLHPSFEELARKRARAPQDNVQSSWHACRTRPLTANGFIAHTPARSRRWHRPGLPRVAVDRRLVSHPRGSALEHLADLAHRRQMLAIGRAPLIFRRMLDAAQVQNGLDQGDVGGAEKSESRS